MRIGVIVSMALSYSPGGGFSAKILGWPPRRRRDKGAGNPSQALLGAISIIPTPNDHRFAGPLWQMPPFSQGCLLGGEWWARATNGSEGIGRADQRI
jgi:hypothetical protein